MHRSILLSLAIAVVAVAPAAAQAPQQTRAGVDCPTISEQKTDVNKRHTDGTEGKAAIPAERSGILPSAGNYPESASPTIQQSGQVMPSPLDCPLKADHPNAIQPGAVQADMPDQSKTK